MKHENVTEHIKQHRNRSMTLRNEKQPYNNETNNETQE